MRVISERTARRQLLHLQSDGFWMTMRKKSLSVKKKAKKLNDFRNKSILNVHIQPF